MIPNLPTDNLYKFMAISGLVTIIGCFYVNAIKSREINDKMYVTTQSGVCVPLLAWAAIVIIAKNIYIHPNTWWRACCVRVVLLSF